MAKPSLNNLLSFLNCLLWQNQSFVAKKPFLVYSLDKTVFYSQTILRLCAADLVLLRVNRERDDTFVWVSLVHVPARHGTRLYAGNNRAGRVDLFITQEGEPHDFFNKRKRRTVF